MSVTVNGEPVPTTEGTPMVSPELGAAMAETRMMRELLTEVLRTFGDSSGDGWRSRVGQVKYRQWRKRAGLDGSELIETAGTE